MVEIIIASGVIVATSLFFYLKNIKKNQNTAYWKIKKKLYNEINQANQTGDWKKRQEINLQLLWLKTINEVDNGNIAGGKGQSKKYTLFNTISLDDIKFPVKWNLDDLYCYPFAQEIIYAYGDVLAENEYEGMFKPESILPVPKNYIKKAITFTFDYFNLKEPIYSVPDKIKRVDNLNTIKVFLDLHFIPTDNDELPKSSAENYKVGLKIQDKLKKPNEIEDLNLADWRSDSDWIVRGVRYAEKENFKYAFACYEQAKKINPQNKDLVPILSLTYLHIGEQHYEKGDVQLAFENIRKAAELNNKEAIEWLNQHSKE